MKRALKSLAKRWLPPALQDQLRAVPANEPAMNFDLPVAALEDLFPGSDSAIVRFPMSQWTRTRDMVLPLADYLAVGALVRIFNPKRIFEIGTFNGSTSLLMALNCNAEIFTLDLPPDELSQAMKERFIAGSEFAATPEARRIRQLYGRSETFDYSPYYGTMDLVYIDALHSYEAVKHDSESALKLLRPGGVILWDDYLWDPIFPECAGVTRALDELAARIPCHAIRGTRLAVHRSQARG